MRGEHHDVAGELGKVRGSSPHARGAPYLVSVSVGPHGIIPACAGSTSPRWSARGSRGDHPRMRGEHVDYEVTPALGEGSSPHARGAQALSRHFAGVAGIIPACAGSTL